jgi:formylglycine-generating enzyme required for sulfatase activity
VRVPAGSSKIGAQRVDRRAPNFDEAANADEGPVCDVELSEYFIGRYPVTVIEYERFMRDDGYGDPRWWTAGGFGQWSSPDDWEDDGIQDMVPGAPLLAGRGD